MRIRTYRHGLGDCHLVRLPASDGGTFNLMIDCGVILGTQAEGIAKLKSAVLDIVDETKGDLDVVVATHEHWDHVSGFLQARQEMTRLSVGEVWFAWTEDPSDKIAARLKAGRNSALAAVRAAHDAGAVGVGSLLDFFGAAGGNSTADAMKAVRSLVKGPPRYLQPAGPPWTSPRLKGVRVFALGPPRDDAFIHKLLAPKETYGLAAAAFKAAAGDSEELLASPAGGQPFELHRRLSLRALAAAAADRSHASGPVDFFREHYFGVPGTDDQAWRRIDLDWLSAAQDFALNLDSATNNTSLVLAIELSPGGKVLLFAADAQVGNWLSWQGLSWTLDDGRTVTGPDLLRRTVFYKVGHHGSHNATLRQKGLELMESDELKAIIPVDHDMAVAKKWGQMPLPALLQALDERTGGRTARTDQPPANAPWVDVDDLWLEVKISP